MTYLPLILGAASMAVAFTPPSYDTTEPGASFPTFTVPSGTGYYPVSTDGLTGFYPTGTAVPTGGYGPGTIRPIGPLHPSQPIYHNPQPSGPVHLSPYVHPDTDTTDPDHVTPKLNHTLHYAEGQKRAEVNFEFHQPTVPLEYISAVKDITCPSDTELHLTFDNSDLFDKATDDWPNSGSLFNLIDNTEGCGKSAQRTFFQVQSYTVDKDTLSVQTKGKQLSASDPEIVNSFNATWGHVRPTSTTTDTSMITTAPDPKEKRGLNGRGFFSKFKSEVVGKASELVSEAKGDASAAESNVLGILPTKVFSKASTINVDLEPTETKSPSPWGDAVNMQTVDGVTVWCIDCGMHGDILVSGSMSVGLSTPFLKAGSIDVEAQNFQVPMTFGFQAENAKLGRKSFTFTILDVGIPGFSIPDVFVVGPQFTVGVSFTVALSASGNLEAGVNMAWPDAKAHLDLVNSDTSASTNDGWTPTVDKVFNVSDGQLAINGSLGVPLGIGIGIEIADGKLNKSISITDTPSIELDSVFNTEGNQKRSHPRELLAPRQDTTCSNGIEEIVKFNDIVGLNVVDLWKTQLASWGTTVFSTCIATAASSASGGSSGLPSSAPVVTTPAGTAPAVTGTASAGALLMRDVEGAPFPAGQQFDARAARAGPVPTA
ncbi:MAG: hypothetical protein Q9195_004761 [Heterodermia aff. obscurata]